MHFIDDLIGEPRESLSDKEKTLVDAADEIYSYYENEPYHAHVDVIESECVFLYPELSSEDRKALSDWAAGNFPSYIK